MADVWNAMAPTWKWSTWKGHGCTAPNLTNADLTGAYLSRANLSRARNLTQAQLNAACGDTNTKLPEGLTIKQTSD
jgi:uncharacterized protein YjbI with pentapeptide repeats